MSRRGKPTGGLRMQELVKATGARKSTILFYLAQGLLPPPIESGPNSAVYDPDCVERIRLIRRLQANHRLTIAEIRDHLAAGTPDAPGALLQLQETVFGRPEEENRVGRTAFCRATGLRPSETDALARAGLLRPSGEEAFDAKDIEMGRALRDALALGLRPRDLDFYVEHGEAIVAAEMALRNRLTGLLPPTEDATATARMVRLARLCRVYVVDRIFRERVAAMRTLKDDPTPPRREPEQEPWLD